MTHATWLRAVLVSSLVVSYGCTPRAQEPGSSSTTPEPTGSVTPVTITDRDWQVVEVGALIDPRGANDRHATLRFDSATSKAAGFAGCNQYSAGYTLSGDTLHFEPAVATRMACAQGMDLENLFLSILPEVTMYQATDSVLILATATGPLARLRAP